MNDDLTTPIGIESAQRRGRSASRSRAVLFALIAATLANATQGDREDCLAAGMDDYVTKLIRVQALVRALMAATARAQG